MRIAVCSLSQFAHVSEFVNVAQRLQEKHEVYYFVGFSCQSTIRLLETQQVPYKVLLNPELDIESVLTVPSVARSTYDLFRNYFIKHAQLVLPNLLEELCHWRPDLILSYLRDYAGITAAEILDIPVASFGSLPSPVRIEGIDPPFGAGVSKDAPKRVLRMMWKFHHDFNNRVDSLYNEVIRRPFGLDDIHQVSTFHSRRLVLLGTIPLLSNKHSPDPPYIKYVGRLFSGTGAPAEEDEVIKIARVASSPKPRILVSLGTTYVEPLLEKCLRALTAFPGTIVVTPGHRMDDHVRLLVERKNVVWAPFFSDFDAVLEQIDAVVTVTAAKTVLASLAAGKPLVCLPRQGEQVERAYRLQSLGAAEMPCPRRWDPNEFAASVKRVATEGRYKQAASSLQASVKSSGGVDQAIGWLDTVLSEGK